MAKEKKVSWETHLNKLRSSGPGILGLLRLIGLEKLSVVFKHGE